MIYAWLLLYYVAPHGTEQVPFNPNFPMSFDSFLNPLQLEEESLQGLIWQIPGVWRFNKILKVQN